MELYFLIMAPIFASLLIYLLPERVAFYLNALVHAAMFSVSVYLFRCVRFSQEVIVTRTGADQFLNMTLYCDLTTSVFLLLVTFLFFCVFVYSYKKSWANRLYSFLFAVLEGLISCTISYSYRADHFPLRGPGGPDPALLPLA